MCVYAYIQVSLQSQSCYWQHVIQYNLLHGWVVGSKISFPASFSAGEEGCMTSCRTKNKTCLKTRSVYSQMCFLWEPLHIFLLCGGGVDVQTRGQTTKCEESLLLFSIHLRVKKPCFFFRHPSQRGKVVHKNLKLTWSLVISRFLCPWYDGKLCWTVV